jgi:hypothetical protein
MPTCFLVGAQAHTTDVAVAQPEHGGGEFLPKIYGYEYDVHIGREGVLVSLPR